MITVDELLAVGSTEALVRLIKLKMCDGGAGYYRGLSNLGDGGR